MIRCVICQGRVRPPARPWSALPDGGVHFYNTTPGSMEVYAKWLGRLAKKVPLAHERCVETAQLGTLPEKYVTALDLDGRLRHQQSKGGSR